jgi:hypothetical protein
LALSYYHRRCSIPDKEAIEMLEKQVISLERTSGDRPLLLAGQFLWYFGEGTKAKKLLKAVINQSIRL